MAIVTTPGVEIGDEAQVRDVNDGPMLVPRVRRESMSWSPVARERSQSGEIGTLLGQGDASRLLVVGLSFTELVGEMVRNSLPEWMSHEAEAADGTGACRDYDDPAIRHPGRAVVRDGGCEVAGGTAARFFAFVDEEIRSRARVRACAKQPSGEEMLLVRSSPMEFH